MFHIHRALRDEQPFVFIITRQVDTIPKIKTKNNDNNNISIII